MENVSEPPGNMIHRVETPYPENNAKCHCYVCLQLLEIWILVWESLVSFVCVPLSQMKSKLSECAASDAIC